MELHITYICAYTGLHRAMKVYAGSDKLVWCYLGLYRFTSVYNIGNSANPYLDSTVSIYFHSFLHVILRHCESE